MRNLIRAIVLAALVMSPLAAAAEQPAPPADAAMPCPHAGQEGGCCGGACAAMQGQAAAGAPDQAAPAEGGGCPCQRAKAAKAAAAAAEAAKQAQP